MKITFLGASGTVTGSSYLLTGEQNQTILIDLGLFQGEGNADELNAAALSFDASALTAVLLTHAHLDHCGRLPLLVQAGYKGKVYATEATRDITHISLLDAASIQDEDKTDKPLYTKDDVEELYKRFSTVSYDEQFTIGEFTITYRNAGHILGSASIEISDNDKTIVFSGDLGNTPETLIQPTEYEAHADWVVMESTYGSSTHPREDALAVLQKEIEAITSTNGVLLIPSFSIERSQELLHALHTLSEKNMIQTDIPVFLDSPMAIEVTELFKKFPHLYSTELSHDSHPFDFQNLTYTKSVQDSKAINAEPTPKIIIAGSGMMSGGRILHHLHNYISLPTTRILFVGYQAVGTLGRDILDGATQIMLYDQPVEVRATVTKLEAFSSHADEPKLLTWLQNIKGVQKVFLVHGEDLQRKTLAESITQNIGIQDVVLPIRGETETLEI